MFTYGRALGLLLPIIALGSAASCSPSKPGGSGIDGGDSGGSSGTGTGGGGSGGSAGGAVISMGGSGGTVSVAGMGSGATAGSGTEACAEMITPGMTVPVDVYVMLDISGSMLNLAGPPGSTTSRWTAVQAALSAFLSDPPSAGLNVAIQYFPLRVPGVPTTCSTDLECGDAAPCVVSVCQQTPQVFVTCTPSADAADLAPCTNAVLRDDGPCTAGLCHLSGKACTAPADCQTIAPPLGKCVDFGVCEGDQRLYCADTNPATNHAGCGPGGTVGKCIPVSTHFCAHETVCNPDTYKAPAVDYLTLPDSANLLMSSIAAQMPLGDTPSRPALRGAIAHARERAKAVVGHSQLVLLATDGMPSDCTGGREVSGVLPAALDDVVAVATEGLTPVVPEDASVTTFVVGVFDDTETDAQGSLDRIAMAGGSEHAFVVSSGGDVQRKFLDALAEIRKARLGCEFQIPPPPAGQKLDYKFVNVKVKHNDATADKGLFYVAPDKCTGMDDEWHYDCDIADVGCKPTKIIACPKACEALGATTNAQGVNVGLGCKSNVR